MLGIGGGGDVVGALARRAALRGSSAPSSCSAASPGSGCRSTRTRARAPVEQIHGGRAARATTPCSPAPRPRRPRASCSPSRTWPRTSAPDRPDRRHRRRRRRRRGHRAPPRASSAATSSSTPTSAATRSRPATSPGLGSPLCDAVMLAAGHAAARPRLDGVDRRDRRRLRRRADARRGARPGRGAGRRAGAWIGTFERRARRSPTRSSAPRRRRGTEASLQLARCARGELGEAEIRGGRRRVAAGPGRRARLLLRPRGGRCRSCRWRRPCATPTTSKPRRAALNAIGVRTELDYERDRAEPPGGSSLSAIRERVDSRCGRGASRARSPRGGRGARCGR